MDKLIFVYFVLLLFVIFHTGNSASTKKDGNITAQENTAGNSSTKNLSELNFNAIMDECNASFRIDIDFLNLLNFTGILTARNSIQIETDLFLNYQISEIDDGFLFAEYLKSLNDSGSFPDETEKTPKCYIRCYFVNIGVMTEDGEFDKDVAAILFSGKRDGKDMNDISEMIDKCLMDRNETCKCEKAYAFARCLMETEIEKYENE